MAYSMKQFTPEQSHDFPPPPTYVTWVEQWRSWKGETPGGKGQLRHMPTLKKAREHVKAYTNRHRDKDLATFSASWKIYEWVGDLTNGRYEVIFEGQMNDPIKSNPLFQIRFTASGQERELNEDELAEALAAIHRSAAGS